MKNNKMKTRANAAKRMLMLFITCISCITAFAQNTVLQNPTATVPKQDFWTPENLWILICTVVITGFILLVIYAMSTATISLAKQVEQKT